MNGCEWVVEAYGCDPVRLGSAASLRGVFDALVSELALHPVSAAQWHTFPAPGGVTGMQMLAESHLTVHSFPEHASLCINLFCCTPRREWEWSTRLRDLVGAKEVVIRRLDRAFGRVQRHETAGRKDEPAASAEQNSADLAPSRVSASVSSLPSPS